MKTNKGKSNSEMKVILLRFISILSYIKFCLVCALAVQFYEAVVRLEWYVVGINKVIA